MVVLLPVASLDAAAMQAGDRLGIDFGPTLTAGWNNLTANNQTIPAGSVVRLAGGVLDGVSIATANSQFVNNDGTNNWVGLAANGGLAPPEFVDSVVTDIAGNSTLGDGTPYRVTVSGLDPALVMRVDAVATAVGSPTDTFRVTGAGVHGPLAIPRASARAGQFHSFSHVQANAAGVLVIEVMDSSASANPIVSGILLTAVGAPNSPVLRAWQIDFQGGPGGAFGSANPVAAAADIGHGGRWNAFEVPATNAAVFANPPTAHNAVRDPELDGLTDAAGVAGPVRLSIEGGVSAFNVGRILMNGGVDHAFGDHWFWGAQGLTSETLGFTFSKVPPGTYSLTAYANPDQHHPPRDFGLVVGATTVAIRPMHGASFYADPGTFAGTIHEIEVDGSGLLQGSLTTLAGDPSIAAMVLRQVSAPLSAVAVADAGTLNPGGKWRFFPLANDVVFAPVSGIEMTQPPESGTALVDEDGSILYTHDGGDPVADSFRYRFTDRSGVSNEAEVTVRVSGAIRVDPATVAMPGSLPVTTLSTEDAFLGRGAFNFAKPTWMATIDGNDRRFFVAEKDGIVWEIPDMSANPVTRRVFMDFTSAAWKAAQGGQLDFFTEMGVKAFAFHPQFEHGSPYVHVSYNFEAGPPVNGAVGSVRLSRFTATGSGLEAVDMLSEVVVIEIDSGSQDHNIDGVRFGPDGYLYLGFGDERNPGGNSQTITSKLWSSIIRIDVDRREGNLEPNPAVFVKSEGGVAHFKVPADNPFAASSGTVVYNGVPHAWNAVRSEIYVTGVRNPWQFSFDEIDGEPVIWHGDVGSDGGSSREEVNLLRKGDNAGWRIREGGAGLQGYINGAGELIQGPLAGTTYAAVPAGVELRDPEWFYGRGSGTYQGFRDRIVRGSRRADAESRSAAVSAEGHLLVGPRGEAPVVRPAGGEVRVRSGQDVDLSRRRALCEALRYGDEERGSCEPAAAGDAGVGEERRRSLWGFLSLERERHRGGTGWAGRCVVRPAGR